MARKILIVGGVAGGASAAARLRRLDEDAHIVMFERDAYISFANCGLPYYIGNSIKDRSKLLVQTPEAMTRRFGLDIRTESEVIGLNADAKTVTVRSASNGLYEESYDALILSPGAKPLKPDIPGIGNPKVHTLRNIPDMDRIKEQVGRDGVRAALVVGGGYIGVEMAENLRELGLDVTLIQSGSQILAPFDPEMASALAKEMEQNGVKLIMNDSVRAFADAGERIEASLAGGWKVAADIVIWAAGVVPDTNFLKDSGLELGERGHIRVNERLETNLQDVFAVGDAVEVVDYVSGRSAAIPLAGPANKQGRIAADNACGLRSSYKGTQGTSIIKVFGLTGAATGLNEKMLKRFGIPYRVTVVHPSSHAGYYPGASPMTLKLIFNDEGRVLGAQAVGADGVDKRIDSIAAVIRLRGSVADLTELELAYAPPFSSAKDPVNMAGYTAENILTGRTNVFTADELGSRSSSGTMLIDVRTVLEHENGHIPGSLHIPVDELRERLGELDPAKEIWVYCQVGLRGYTASRILLQKGFSVRNLTGGYKSYQMAQYKPNPPRQPLVMIPPAGAESAAAAEAVAGQAPLPKEVVAQVHAELDACGLSCPGPLIEVKQKIDAMQEGQVLRVTATDPGFYEDISAWAAMSRNELLRLEKKPRGVIEAYVRKPAAAEAAAASPRSGDRPEGSSLIVFSGDLDKAIASFIIANGAAASGKKVTMFFTFWGLNVIRRSEKVAVEKSFIGKMFGLMMPRGSRKLGMSRMNMGGMGAKMIRGVMKGSNISSLEELIQTAIGQGVEVVACTMSMDVMGIKREELIDGVKLGGVGYYLGKADQSGINLFI